MTFFFNENASGPTQELKSMPWFKLSMFYTDLMANSVYLRINTALEVWWPTLKTVTTVWDTPFHCDTLGQPRDT